MAKKTSLIYRILNENSTLIIIDGDKKISYDLQQVTQEEILQLREKGVCGFILKSGDDLFFSKVEDNFYIAEDIEGLSQHKCSDCSRCRAILDDQIGCTKVFDPIEQYFYKREMKLDKDAIRASKRIEKYQFIALGYETFNVKNPCFVVYRCVNYRKDIERHVRH